MKPVVEEPPADDSYDEHERSLSWPVLRRQYLARFVFSGVLFAYLVFAEPHPQVLFGRVQLTWLFLLYLLLVAGFMLRARFQPHSIGRAQTAMWLDYIALTLLVSHDPYPTLPSLLVLLTVLLGNGLRYGQRLLLPALIGSLAAVPMVVALRGWGGALVPNAGTTLMLGLYATVACYAAYLIWQGDRLRGRLRALSHRDKLTGILNRRALFARGEAIFNMQARTGRPVTVALVDIQGLAAINQRLGFVVGNRVLREVARALGYGLRNYDVAGRVGDDSFLVLLPDTELEQARIAMMRAIELARAGLSDLPGAPVALTLAMASAPDDGTAFNEILGRLEQEMTTKEDGWHASSSVLVVSRRVRLTQTAGPGGGVGG